MADAPRDPEAPDPDDQPAPSEEPTRPTEQAPGGGTRRLTRSGSDSLIGGVAGGLGRYFSVDPILFRIGFVVLTFMGGLGVLTYLALLVFVPSDGEGRAQGAGKVAPIAGAVALGLALIIFLGPPVFFFGPGLLVIGLVVLAGVLLWRALGGESDGDPGRTAARIAVACLIAVGCIGAAVGVGIAAALGGGVVIASLAVVAGLALIGTAFVGGARWLIVPAVALVLPLGFVAAADIDLDGGIGDRSYRPATMSELHDSYDIGIGSMDIDLRDLDLPDGRTDVTVDVGLGEAVVYVPREACVTSDVQIGAGAGDVLDRDNSGVDLSMVDANTAPAGRPHLHVNADVGVGVVEVVREGFQPDLIGPDHWGPNRQRFGVDVPQDTNCTA